MKNHFIRLYKYNAWANNRIFDLLESLETPTERSLGHFTHVINAQSIWMSRFTDAKYEGGLFGVKPLSELRIQAAENERNLNRFFEQSTEETFESLFSYKSIKGEPFTNSMSDILTHLANHGSHHRAQILSDMKPHVEVLPVIDFIAFARI